MTMECLSRHRQAIMAHDYRASISWGKWTTAYLRNWEETYPSNRSPARDAALQFALAATERSKSAPPNPALCAAMERFWVDIAKQLEGASKLMVVLPDEMAATTDLVLANMPRKERGSGGGAKERSVGTPLEYSKADILAAENTAAVAQAAKPIAARDFLCEAASMLLEQAVFNARNITEVVPGEWVRNGKGAKGSVTGILAQRYFEYGEGVPAKFNASTYCELIAQRFSPKEQTYAWHKEAIAELLKGRIPIVKKERDFDALIQAMRADPPAILRAARDAYP